MKPGICNAAIPVRPALKRRIKDIVNARGITYGEYLEELLMLAGAPADDQTNFIEVPTFGHSEK